MINKFRIYQISTIGSFFLLLAYASVVSVFAFKNNVVVKVFEVTPSGTWFVSDPETSKKYEKINFLKEFLTHFYSYNSGNFRDEVSRAGDFMAAELWKEKTQEFLKIEGDLKSRPLWQEFVINNIELKGEDEIVVDLTIKIYERISSPIEKKLRAILKLGRHDRGDQENNYPFEVVSYVEENRS